MPDALQDLELLEKLVGFDTTSHRSTSKIADFISAYLEQRGVRVERMPSPCGEKENLLAAVGPEPDGARTGLLLSGHLDVVPATEPGWSGDPFVLRVMDGHAVGRGACDMKGFLALAINLLSETAEQTLAHPLMLLLTFDEERGSLGAMQFGRTWPSERPLPHSTIVGEPTSLTAVRMHKGHLSMRIRILGSAAHSGSPHLGSNAIESSARVVQALAEHARSLRERSSTHAHCFAEVPHAVLSVTMIGGGTAINVVPDECVLHAGLRLMPGDDSSTAMQELVACLEGEPVEVDILHDNPPMLLDAGSSIWQEFSIPGGEDASCGVGYASDAGFLSRDLGMECILWGPGSIAVAHKPNEFLPLDEFAEAASVLRGVVDRVCALGEHP